MDYTGVAKEKEKKNEDKDKVQSIKYQSINQSMIFMCQNKPCSNVLLTVIMIIIIYKMFSILHWPLWSSDNYIITVYLIILVNKLEYFIHLIYCAENSVLM